MIWDTKASKRRDFARNLTRLAESGETFTANDLSDNSKFLNKFTAVNRLKTLRRMGLKMERRELRIKGESIVKYHITDKSTHILELLKELVWR